MTILETARLRLEPIDERHFAGLQAMNSRPEVMRHISGRPETPEETRAMIAIVPGPWSGLSSVACQETTMPPISGAMVTERTRLDCRIASLGMMESVTTRLRSCEPKPNQTTNSGAIAAFGIVCEATIKG